MQARFALDEESSVTDNARAALAVAGATLVALALAWAIPFLVETLGMFGQGDVADNLAAAVILPCYVYALIAVFRGRLRKSAEASMARAERLTSRA